MDRMDERCGGAERLVSEAIAAFQNGELISAGNKFLDAYEAVQNAHQAALSNFLHGSVFPIDIQTGKRFLIQDAALCFYLANSKDVARKKGVYSAWPKTRSKVRHVHKGGVEDYEPGVGVGTIIKDSITHLDAILSGCANTRAIAERLSLFCRFLGDVGRDGRDGFAIMECILALSSVTPPQIMRKLNHALEYAERTNDTSASEWIKECINEIEI